MKRKIMDVIEIDCGDKGCEDCLQKFGYDSSVRSYHSGDTGCCRFGKELQYPDDALHADVARHGSRMLRRLPECLEAEKRAADSET